MVDGCVVIFFVVVVGFIVLVVVVTGGVIFIRDDVKFPTVVEFMFMTTVATNTFLIILDEFVCAITVVAEVAADAPVLVEDALVGDVAREKSSVVVILVVVWRIGTMPDFVAGVAGGAVFVANKILVVAS